ncbi:hypothetical protein [Campylobacter phage CJLB-7]|nr:hypothetical protein [Campylobacter phage CJLB-7]
MYALDVEGTIVTELSLKSHPFALVPIALTLILT